MIRLKKQNVLYDWLVVICQEAYLETQLKVYDRAFFAKIVKNFLQKALSEMFEWVLNRFWAIMSETYLKHSQKSKTEHFYENS